MHIINVYLIALHADTNTAELDTVNAWNMNYFWFLCVCVFE